MKRLDIRGGEDAIAIFFLIPIVILVLFIFVISPILFIVGGAKMITAAANAQAIPASVEDLITTSLFGVILNYFLSFVFVPKEIKDSHMPDPPQYNPSFRPSYEEEEKYQRQLKKWKWTVSLPVTLITIVLFVMIVFLSHQIICFWNVAPKNSGIIIVILGALLLASNLRLIIKLIAFS